MGTREIKVEPRGPEARGRTRERMSGSGRRQLILSAAAQLFSEKGYARTSMADIASVVGVKKGSLYYFYESKDALLFDIFRFAIRIPQERSEPIVQSSQSNAAKLRQLIHVLVRSYADALPMMVTFTRISVDTVTHPKRLAELKGLRRRYEKMWRDVIAAGVASGELRSDLDHKLVIFAILGMINWMYKWYSPEGRIPNAEIANSFTALVLEGLLDRSSAGSLPEGGAPARASRVSGRKRAPRPARS